MNWRIACVLAACAAALSAGTPPETVLTIESENFVYYFEDIGDPQRFATSAVPVAGRSINFCRMIWLADIVRVNGKPAKGALVSRVTLNRLRPNPTGDTGIADISRNNINETHVEIQQADGTPVGSLTLGGLGSGHPPLGAPASAVVGNFAVLGGTGAFLGARGQAASATGQTGRMASFAENPINRRIHPGAGIWTLVVHVIPMTRPEVLTVPTGPAIFHGEDFSPVTAEKPARAGELLVMSVSGLGPVKPNLDPGKPFPAWVAGKEHVVNSPVDVTVNGKTAPVISALGWPGMNNVYRVDFRVPEGTAAGTATLGLSVAWINGPEVKFPVR